MNFAYCPQCGHKDTVQKLNDTDYECSDCQWHFWNNAKAAVGVMLIKDGQMLFGERAIEPQKGKLDFPGGFVEYNEDAYAAAAREVSEETGLTIKNPTITFVGTHEYKPGYSTVDLLMTVTEWEGDIQPGDDIASLSWCPIGVLDSDEFAWPWPGLTDALKKQLRRSTL
ncbi:MAG TPA: NUDIX domain-containing protein [Candidatus Saccharimonadales bacterium]|jgi:ADP-ribose pyrophosphatase YjhB (NUDIX family)|nr:NUDIX domain-containing protein [Candidatus Saccharimonadales bacterium]